MKKQNDIKPATAISPWHHFSFLEYKRETPKKPWDSKKKKKMEKKSNSEDDVVIIDGS